MSHGQIPLTFKTWLLDPNHLLQIFVKKRNKQSSKRHICKSTELGSFVSCGIQLRNHCVWVETFNLHIQPSLLALRARRDFSIRRLQIFGLENLIIRLLLQTRLCNTRVYLLWLQLFTRQQNLGIVIRNCSSANSFRLFTPLFSSQMNNIKRKTESRINVDWLSNNFALITQKPSTTSSLFPSFRNWNFQNEAECKNVHHFHIENFSLILALNKGLRQLWNGLLPRRFHFQKEGYMRTGLVSNE